MIRVGIGGWTYAPWRGRFYPEGLPQKRELAHAAGLLTSIEINGTFYRNPGPDSFAKWHDEVPDGFVFAVKAPRFATSRRRLAEAGEAVERFLTGGLLRLGAKLGPVNWQFAPTKRFEPEDFAAFLELLPAELEGRRLRHAVELRHDSFAVPEAVALARARGIAIVIAGDSPHPQIGDATADFVYARIMGTVEAEPLGHPPAALDRWAERARSWASGGQPADIATVAPPDGQGAGPRDVFLYVIGGFKAHNPAAARALIERLER